MSIEYHALGSKPEALAAYLIEKTYEIAGITPEDFVKKKFFKIIARHIDWTQVESTGGSLWSVREGKSKALSLSLSLKVYGQSFDV